MRNMLANLLAQNIKQHLTHNLIDLQLWRNAFPYHVTNTGCRKTIQTTLDLGDGDDVKILRPSVVSAIHDGCDGKTKRHAELAAAGATSTSFGHSCFSQSV